MSIVVLLATAVAAGVEWVEALTIVLAVGIVKGWRSAFVGMVIAFAALAVLVAVFGITITSHVSIDAARTVVGVFLLLFGLKWLHKAILRSSRLKSLHDEARRSRRRSSVSVRKPRVAGSTASGSRLHWGDLLRGTRGGLHRRGPGRPPGHPLSGGGCAPRVARRRRCRRRVPQPAHLAFPRTP